MRRFYSSALAGAILLMGASSVQADDFVIEEGSVVTRNSSASSDLYIQDGNTFTTRIDIDCSSGSFYSSDKAMKLMGAQCLQKIIDKHNNLGKAVAATAAMNTAMSALPASSHDAKTTCGVGTGGSSGEFALSAGCASNLTDRFSINTGGSVALGGFQDYGSGNIDSYGVQAGFLYKFGPIKKTTLISMNDKKAMQAEVKTLKGENQELKDLVAKQNERLEKLETIALANQNDQKTANSFFNISNLFSTMRSFLISSN